MNFFRRWHTSHGYGVHSPFAYVLITKVLREFDAQYYAYAEIDALCPKGRRTAPTTNFSGFNYAVPDAHLLFRLLCRFNPTEIVEVGYGHEVTNTIIERSVPHARRLRCVPDRLMEVEPKGQTFVLLNELHPGHAQEVRRLILDLAARPEGVTVFMRQLKTCAPITRLWREMKAAGVGMTFTNGHLGLLCTQKGLPAQHFELYF